MPSDKFVRFIAHAPHYPDNWRTFAQFLGLFGFSMAGKVGMVSPFAIRTRPESGKGPGASGDLTEERTHLTSMFRNFDRTYFELTGAEVFRVQLINCTSCGIVRRKKDNVVPVFLYGFQQSVGLFCRYQRNSYFIRRLTCFYIRFLFVDQHLIDIILELFYRIISHRQRRAVAQNMLQQAVRIFRLPGLPRTDQLPRDRKAYNGAQGL